MITDQKDEMREQIIEASRHIFRKFGFKKTTMDDIAKSVGKGKSSIYYYYTSKDQVFQAVVEKEAQLLKNELLIVIDSSLNPTEKLKTFILTRLTKFGEMTNFYNAIKDELLNHLDYIEKIRKKYDEDEINHIASILFEGVEKQEFIVGDTRLAATAIVTAMKGLEMPLFWQNGADNIEERLNNVVQILLFGLVKR